MVEDFKSFDEVMKTWSEKLELFVCLELVAAVFDTFGELREWIKHHGTTHIIKNQHALCRDLYPPNSRPVVIDSYRQPSRLCFDPGLFWISPTDINFLIHCHRIKVAMAGL
jgi:hypothetical protein